MLHKKYKNKIKSLNEACSARDGAMAHTPIAVCQPRAHRASQCLCSHHAGAARLALPTLLLETDNLGAHRIPNGAPCNSIRHSNIPPKHTLGNRTDMSGSTQQPGRVDAYLHHTISIGKHTPHAAGACILTAVP